MIDQHSQQQIPSTVHSALSAMEFPSLSLQSAAVSRASNGHVAFSVSYVRRERHCHRQLQQSVLHATCTRCVLISFTVAHASGQHITVQPATLPVVYLKIVAPWRYPHGKVHEQSQSGWITIRY